jgi:hypothetical protein
MWDKAAGAWADALDTLLGPYQVQRREQARPQRMQLRQRHDMACCVHGNQFASLLRIANEPSQPCCASLPTCK